MNKIFTKENQKELKEQFRTLQADVWGTGSRMIDYCTRKAEFVIKTEKGFFLEIEKKSIEKDFCFGYRLSSSDTEEYDSANAMAIHARKSEEYFIEENLKGIKQQIEYLENTTDSLCFTNHYCGQKNEVLKAITSHRPWETAKPSDIELSENDKALMIEAYKLQLENQKKKVSTYLKKYGLSKVHTWSYWQDA